MKKTNVKKFHLSRETLSTLTPEYSKKVAGQLPVRNDGKQPQYPVTSNSVNVCCA